MICLIISDRGLAAGVSGVVVQGSVQFSSFGRGSCYLHWSALGVGVVRLIVLKCGLLLSFGSFNPLYIAGSVSIAN